MSISLLCHAGPSVTNGAAFAVLVSVACLAPLAHVLLSKAGKLQRWAQRRFKARQDASAPSSQQNLELSFMTMAMKEAFDNTELPSCTMPEGIMNSKPPSEYQLQDT